MKHSTDIDHMTVAELQHHVEEATKHLAAIRTLLPGLVSYDHDARTHSSGRLRDGEPLALRSVLDAVALDPSHYAMLADRDEGHDAKRFEADLLRARLDRLVVLKKLADQARALVSDLDDTVLDEGERVKGPLLLAYRVAKMVADNDAKVKSALSNATDFYGAMARAASVTRAKKKASSPAV